MVWVSSLVALAHEGPDAVGRTVERQLSIDRPVPEYIASRADNLLCQRALDDRQELRRAHCARRRGDVRVTPCGRAVPDILHGRIVVQRGAEYQVVCVPYDPVHVAEVHVVRRPVTDPLAVGALVIVVRVRELRERTDSVGDLAGEEDAGGIEYRRPSLGETMLPLASWFSRVLVRSSVAMTATGTVRYVHRTYNRSA